MMDVTVCCLGGVELLSLQMDAQATAGEVREELIAAEVQDASYMQILVGDRVCRDANALVVGPAQDVLIVTATRRAGRSFLDKAELVGALDAFVTGGAAREGIVSEFGDIYFWDVSLVNDMSD